MPIRPEERSRYPKDWKVIVAHIRERAGDKCEWCGALNHEPHPDTGSLVICTTAHLNHTPEDCRDENLAYLCQKCHNGYDAKHRAAGIKERKLQDEKLEF